MKKIVSSLSIGSTMLLSGMLNASTFLIDGTSITSDGVGFSQNTANTYYLPSTNGELTNITFSDGRGINITSLNELNVPSSPDINIVGILSGGSTVNAIIGLGMVSNVVITDAISGQDLTGDYGSVLRTGPRPAFVFDYRNGTLTVSAVNDSAFGIEQINADGTFLFQNGPTYFLLGDYLLARHYTLIDATPSLLSSSYSWTSTINTTTLLLNGAHSRPMSRRVAKGEKTFWLAGDWGNNDHGSQSGSTGLAEVSGGYNFGPVQVNASLGKYWGSSNLVNNGDIDSDGNYIMVEGIIPVSAAKGLYATVGTFYQSGEVDIDRAYLVSGAVEESSASPDSRTWGLRARLDWENAFAYKSARFSPYADIWHSRAKLDGYTETGGGFPARFDSREDNITELRAGLNLALPTSAPAVEFVANIEGVHRFTSSADSTTGEIIGIGSFDLDGQDFRQNWLKGGVGLEAKIGQGKGSLMLNGTTRGEAANAWLAASYQMAF